MCDTQVVEKRLVGRHSARKASMYFRQGDLPKARFFFSVLKEIMAELSSLEAEAVAQRKMRDRLLAPRKPWFERP